MGRSKAAPIDLMPGSASLGDRARAVAAIAAAHADEVDTRGRFPREAVEALREARLLGAMVPAGLGGEGAGMAQLADVCFILGRACGSTAMIYAMHQIQVACILRHHGGAPWMTRFIERLAEQQLLVASSTTEGLGGGQIRSSRAAVETADGGIRLAKTATVLSYGEQADAILTTAKRNLEAAASDQVLIVFPKDNYRLERTGDWDALGMRGTCSLGFSLEAQGGADQILGAAYARIHAQTMAPTAHLLWSSAWAGSAAEAVERARKFMRKSRLDDAERQPPGAGHLVRAKASLSTLCALISASVARYESLQDQAAALESIEYQTAVCLLKVQASELAVSAVMSALQTCGLAGYRNDSKVSLSRLLRDLLSAPLMINNARMMTDIGLASLIDPSPTSLRGGAL